jgi:hypothetical protein
MRIIAFLVAALLSFSACRAESQPETVGTLELRVSGGFLGPAFVVSISDRGMLVVTRTDHGAATPETAQKQLSASERQEILLLASQSTDFNFGCDRAIPDGTNAVLRAAYSGRRFERQVALCGAWPSGPRTISLLSAISRHLPSDMQIF